MKEILEHNELYRDDMGSTEYQIWEYHLYKLMTKPLWE